MSWHCTYCGTKEKTNTIEEKTKGDRTTSCSDCEQVFRWYQISKPTKTIEEADESFNTTKLKDSQRYGGTTRGKPQKRRKRKIRKKQET